MIINKEKVLLLPDMFNWMPDDFKGEWMLHSDFTYQVVIDQRTKQQRALRSEFYSEDSIIKEINVWNDKPTIYASREVKQHLTNNSVIYHLEK